MAAVLERDRAILAGLPDAADVCIRAFARGLEPDPPLWIDEWAEEHMRIPAEAGAAEPGPYRVARTPWAREPMRCLSPEHSCRRVVTKVASQLFKTQVALNFLAATIDRAPANALLLEPTLSLARRVSSRVAKTIAATPRLRARVAEPRSRDARNTADAKEYPGGALYITTSGSAANLAEISARYVVGDEVSRWGIDVDGEGDPVEMAEARGSTFGKRAKFYWASSPTIEGACAIDALFQQSDQRHCHVPCPHCGEYQELLWEHMRWDEAVTRAWYVCQGCGAEIDERHKPRMFEAHRWVAATEGDGETVGFTLSALYMPLGWVAWLSLVRQYLKARTAEQRGDPEPMQVFRNTRLGLTWKPEQTVANADALRARAEPYRLGTLERGVLVLTATVDVQAGRLELLVIGWGEGLERWAVDYRVVQGDPADPRTWAQLDELLLAKYQHPSGKTLSLRGVAIDTGGTATQEVYDFVRRRRYRTVLGVKGASRPGRPVIAARPSRVDVTHRGTVDKGGAELWLVGTDTAKDWLASRWGLDSGPGAIHFSIDLEPAFYAGLVAEQRLPKYVKGHKRYVWVKPRGAANEPLDLCVYNLAMAHYLGLHRYRQADWERLRMAVDPPTGDLFAVPPAVLAGSSGPSAPAEPVPAALVGAVGTPGTAPAPSDVPAAPTSAAAVPPLAPMQASPATEQLLGEQSAPPPAARPPAPTRQAAPARRRVRFQYTGR